MEYTTGYHGSTMKDEEKFFANYSTIPELSSHHIVY